LMVRGGSPTRVAAMHDVVRHMATENAAATLDALRQPAFVHRTPKSVGESTVSEPVPILVGPDEQPELRVDLATTHATNESASSALAALAAAATEIAFDVPLVPGSMILIDNRRWLHGRGELESTGRDRWLLRSYFVCDSWSTQRANDGVLMVSS
jgi:L-asparagine oxygenase